MFDDKTGVQRVRDFVAAAEDLIPEPPRPLMRELPPVDPFPVDALGGVLGPAACAILDYVQAPMAICGQSVMAAATLSVQGQADIELPTGHAKPVSNFYITVAESGARKSASDMEATWPIHKRETALREKWDCDLPSYFNEKAAWDRARELAIKGKKDQAAIKASLDALGLAPRAPLDPLLTCPEPTFEGLCKLFAVGQPSVGIFATEGGQFVGGHGMSEDAKLRTAAGLSKLWDDGETRRVRSGDGATMLPGRRLAMHLMVQPDVATIMLNDTLLADQGLLSRFLITAPASAAGTRIWHEPSSQSNTAIQRYRARLLSIMETPLPLAPGKANELEPRPLMLSSKSRRLWIAFANHVEHAIAPNGDLEAIRGLANKLPEHAARVAAVLALVDNVEAAEISAEHMEAGIILAQHYAAEALRLCGASRVNAKLSGAQLLLDWLLRTWLEPAVSLADIYQRGPNTIRDKATAFELVALLVDHGWLVLIQGGAVVAGQRRREAWHIVRR